MDGRRAEKDERIVSMSHGERENFWDNIYEKEEGIILEFDMDSKSGKLKSIADGSIYMIDSGETVNTKIALWPGDKVLFAPFDDPRGEDLARVVRIIELED